MTYIVVAIARHMATLARVRGQSKRRLKMSAIIELLALPFMVLAMLVIAAPVPAGFGLLALIVFRPKAGLILGAATFMGFLFLTPRFHP